MSRPALPALFLCLAASLLPSCARKAALVLSDKAFESAFPGATAALAEGAAAAGYKVRQEWVDLDALPGSLFDAAGSAAESTVLLSPLLALEAGNLSSSWPDKRFVAPGTKSPVEAPESEEGILRSRSDASGALSALAAAAAALPGAGPAVLILLSGTAGDQAEEAFRSGWKGDDLVVKRGNAEGPGTEALLREALALEPRFLYLDLGKRTGDALETIHSNPGSTADASPPPVTAGRGVSPLAASYRFIRWSIEDDWKGLARAALQGSGTAKARLVAFGKR